MVIRYRGKKPSLAIPIALTVIGVGVLFLILIVAPYLSHSLFGSISGEHATLVGSLIGAFAGDCWYSDIWYSWFNYCSSR